MSTEPFNLNFVIPAQVMLGAALTFFGLSFSPRFRDHALRLGAVSLLVAVALFANASVVYLVTIAVVAMALFRQ